MRVRTPAYEQPASVSLIKFNIQRQAAQFVYEYVKRLGNAWFGEVVPFDDRFVGFGPAVDIVG